MLRLAVNSFSRTTRARRASYAFFLDLVGVGELFFDMLLV